MQKYGKSARKKCKNERKLHEIGATLSEIRTEKMQNRRRLGYALLSVVLLVMNRVSDIIR